MKKKKKKKKKKREWGSHRKWRTAIVVNIFLAIGYMKIYLLHVTTNQAKCGQNKQKRLAQNDSTSILYMV